MRKGSLVFCTFLIAIAAYAIFAATGWSFKTKLFPLAVSIPLITLLVIQLLLMIGGKEQTGESATMDIDFSIEVPPEVARRRVFGIFGWIVGFIALVYLLGFPLTVPLFIFLYLKFQSNIGWLSLFTDPEGRMNGLFKPSMRSRQEHKAKKAKARKAAKKK